MGGTKIVKDLHSEEMSGVILRGVPKYNRLTHTLIAFGTRCFFMGGTKIVKELYSEEVSGVILRGVPNYNTLTHRGHFKD